MAPPLSRFPGPLFMLALREPDWPQWLGAGLMSRLGAGLMSRLGAGLMSRLGAGLMSRLGAGLMSRLGAGLMSRLGAGLIAAPEGRSGVSSPRCSRSSSRRSRASSRRSRRSSRRSSRLSGRVVGRVAGGEGCRTPPARIAPSGVLTIAPAFIRSLSSSCASRRSSRLSGCVVGRVAGGSVASTPPARTSPSGVRMIASGWAAAPSLVWAIAGKTTDVATEATAIAIIRFFIMFPPRLPCGPRQRLVSSKGNTSAPLGRNSRIADSFSDRNCALFASKRRRRTGPPEPTPRPQRTPPASRPRRLADLAPVLDEQ